jgi:arabinofuranosyltransferase
LDFVGDSSCDRSSRRVLRGFALAFFVVVLLRTAWVSDAAYLALRTAEHAATGHGMRWNIVERVQVFDQPLWVLLVAAARSLTGELYYTTLALSIACSIAAFALLLRQGRTTESAAVVALAAGASSSFVTFSTSGLESPLLHLLLAITCTVALRSGEEAAQRRVLWLAALGGLAVLTRLSVVWIVAPLILVALRGSSWRRRMASLALVLGPTLAWFAWSVPYYGTLGPVAWIADEPITENWRERFALGASFLTASARADPVMALALVVAGVVGFLEDRLARGLAIGSACFLVWVVASGGSPMAGRHLTVLFVLSLVLIARRLNSEPRGVGLATAVGIVALAATVPAPPVWAGASYGADFRPTTRTHDVRAEDYQATGLLLAARDVPIPRHPEAERAAGLAKSGGTVGMSDTPGFFGAAGGSSMYVFAENGTLDPLLARLPPAVGTRWHWERRRRVPDGYEATLPDRPNTIADPAIARWYDGLRTITREPIATRDRVDRLLRLPTMTAAAIDGSSYGPEQVRLSPVAPGQAALHTFVLREGGLRVSLDRPTLVTRVRLVLNGLYDYDVEVFDGSRRVAARHLPRGSWHTDGNVERQLVLPAPTNTTAVHIKCGRGVGPCTVSRVAIE